MAQSGVLEVPRVQLIRGLVRTRTTTDLGAGDALLRCHRFHSLWVGAAGAKLIPDPADQFGVGVTWDGFGHQL